MQGIILFVLCKLRGQLIVSYTRYYTFCIMQTKGSAYSKLCKISDFFALCKLRGQLIVSYARYQTFCIMQT